MMIFILDDSASIPQLLQLQELSIFSRSSKAKALLLPEQKLCTNLSLIAPQGCRLPSLCHSSFYWWKKKKHSPGLLVGSRHDLDSSTVWGKSVVYGGKSVLYGENQYCTGGSVLYREISSQNYVLSRVINTALENMYYMGKSVLLYWESAL
jgi:hypothetical protein